MSELPRLLVADDDPDMRRLLAALLADRAELFEAESGAELLKTLVEEGPFDLVIADVMMSWATGLQVLGMLREAGDFTPFLVITGHDDPPLREEVRALGARLLPKPFEPAALIAAVDEVLGRRRAPLRAVPAAQLRAVAGERR